MKKTILTLASVAAFEGAASAQTWTDLGGNVLSFSGYGIFGSAVASSEDYAGYPKVIPHTSILDGSTRTNPNIGDSLAQFVTPYAVYGQYDFSFASPLTEDVLFSFGGVDRDWTLTGATFVAVDGGSLVSSTSFIHVGGATVNLGNGDILVTAGTTSFSIASNNVNSTGTGFDSWSGTFIAVPEPSSTVLLGLGALGLLARRKR